MAPPVNIIKPPVFGKETNNFAQWKLGMINYLNILEVWDIVVDGYEPIYVEGENKLPTTKLTTDSKFKKKDNDNAVNAIYYSVSESVRNVLSMSKYMDSAHNMWNALVNHYEGNAQIKRTKRSGLNTRFESFRVEDGESIDDMYSRLMSIQNEFFNIGEPLDDERIVEKMLRALMWEPRWEAYVSSLEAMQGANKAFTSDEVYTHLRSFEETLRQAGRLKPESKTVAFPAQNFKSNNYNNYPHTKESASPSFTSEIPQDAAALTHLFQGMLNFEKKYNKERALKNKKVVCFLCQKEGHTIYTCYKIFPKLKERSNEGAQERKPKYQKEEYKHKKKAKAMQATWCIDSDSSESEDSDQEENDEQENLALVAEVSTTNYVEEMKDIIASKNITDELIIAALMKTAEIKEEKRKADVQALTATLSQPESEVHLKINSCSDCDECSSSANENDTNGTVIENQTHDQIDCELEKFEQPINEKKATLSDEFWEKQLNRFKSHLEESNKALFRKEEIIGGLRDDINNLISKVKLFEAKNKDLEKEKEKLIFENSRQAHIGELEILKVRILTLETENRALRSNYASCSTNYDLEKMYIGQKPYDKTGLGYEKVSSSSKSVNSSRPIAKGKSPQKSKEDKNKNCRNIRGHAYMYQRKPKNRYGMNQSNGNHTTSRPQQFSNKIYFKGPNGWFYENKNQDFSKKIWVPKNDQNRGDFQHTHKNKQEFIQKQNPSLASTSNPKNKNVDLKQHFRTHFVKSVEKGNKLTSAFCNYCCKLGHISLECKVKKASNNKQFAWVPRVCTGTGTPSIN